MNVLVTGANGFLGLHIVKKLINDKHLVSAFVLKGTPLVCFKGLPVNIYEGNLLNIDDIRTALQDCDYLIHTAAITDCWPSRNALSWKINFEVVKNIIKVVNEKKIKKFIHIGTANSFGFGSIDNPGTEESEFTGDRYKLDYIDSKYAAQRLLLKEAKTNNLPVVIINPTFMIGPNDSKPGPGELIIPIIEGKNPCYTSGGRCFAAVKDVAIACVNALDKGNIGECYITGGTNLCYKDFFSMIARISKTRPPKIRAPKFLTVFCGSVCEIYGRLFKKKTRLSIAIAKISADGHYYSSEKAIRELDYPQTELEIALNEAITWYRENGYVNNSKKVR